MSWDSFMTWTVVPLGIVLGVLLFYALIEWLNNKKLKYLGCDDILKVVQSGGKQGANGGNTAVNGQFQATDGTEDLNKQGG